jgi:hypothetical protein
MNIIEHPLICLDYRYKTYATWSTTPTVQGAGFWSASTYRYWIPIAPNSDKYILTHPIAGSNCDNDVLYPFTPQIAYKDPRYSTTYIITKEMRCLKRSDFCIFDSMSF